MKSQKSPLAAGAVALTLSLLPAAHGATIIGDKADAIYSLPRGVATYDAGTSGTTNIVLQNNVTTDLVLQVGGTSGNASIATSIIPFQLPALTAGQSFANVSFSLTESSASNGQQVDLYGLGARATAAVLATDYYRGITGGDTTDSTLLQAAFVATTDSFAVNASSATSVGNSALTDYFNAQYAGGAGAGQYVFLRLNVTDAFTTNNSRLNPDSSDNTTVSLDPTITYSVATIPEPASFGLLALGTVGFLARRRRPVAV